MHHEPQGSKRPTYVHSRNREKPEASCSKAPPTSGSLSSTLISLDTTTSETSTIYEILSLPTMSYLATRPNTSAASDGSRTITIQDSNPREEGANSSGEDSEVGRLRLRGATRRDRAGRPRVVWREDVVDNEGAGRKSSKSSFISLLHHLSY